ncbi:MAG: hypothetical protein LBT77_01535 [Mycoplasmataceae bacterium]|nr:hypothetical protein [Mycoplasmataceae bacterium]
MENKLTNLRVTKSNPRGAGRKPGWSVNYVGKKFGGWTVVRNVGYIGKNDKKNYYWILSSPSNQSKTIALRTDVMKKFKGKNLWKITKKTIS